MDFQPVNIDDFDWSSTAPAPEVASDAGVPSPPPEEPVSPPSAPANRWRDRKQSDPRTPGNDLLPDAYREARKNIYKRPPETQFEPMSLDDYDWGGGPVTGGEAEYDPKSDYAITRGFKAAEEQGEHALSAVADMARIATLSPEDQVQEMLRIGTTKAPPSETKLQVGSVTDIGGFGDAITWLGESAGQMAGSMYAAALWGGGSGAATGAAIGGGTGALAGGAGAIPGAAVGAVTGATYGTMAAFGAMGVGGTFRDLLQDQGVQEGLQNGTIDPKAILGWATGAGAVIGALDSVPAMNRFNEVAGKKMTAEAVKQLVTKAAVKGATKGFVEEGATEAVQGAISELAQAIVGGNVDLANRAISVLDQGLAGGIGGAGPGSIGGIAENARIPAPPDRANDAGPAGTASPVVAPEAGAPAGVGGAGASGPGTGYNTKPMPPAGAGEVRSTKREQGKDIAGTPVAEVGVGQTDPDLAAAMGFEEDEEGLPPPTVPSPAAQAPVDPDVSAAMGVEPAGPEAAPPAAPAPYEAVSPWRKRRPRAPAEPTVSTPMPEVQPVVAAPEPVAPTPPAISEAPQVLEEQPVVEQPPLTPAVTQPEQAPDLSVVPSAVLNADLLDGIDRALAHNPAVSLDALPLTDDERAALADAGVTEVDGRTLAALWEERKRRSKAPSPAPIAPSQPPTAVAPPPLALPAPAEPLLLTESPELQALSRYAEGLEPYAPMATPEVTPVEPTARVTKYPDWVKALPQAERKPAMEKLRRAQEQRARSETARQQRRVSKRIERQGTAQVVQPTALADAKRKLDSLTDHQQYEHFYNKLHPALRAELPQRYLPRRRLARKPVQRVQPQTAGGHETVYKRLPELTPEPARAPLPEVKVIGVKQRVKMTLQQYRNALQSRGAEATHKLLERATVRGRGQVVSIADGMATLKGRKKPVPVEQLFRHGVNIETTVSQVPGTAASIPATPIVPRPPAPAEPVVKREVTTPQKAQRIKEIARRVAVRAREFAAEESQRQRERTLQRESRTIEAKIATGEARLIQPTKEWLDTLREEPKPLTNEERAASLEKEAQDRYAAQKAEQHGGERRGKLKGISAEGMAKQDATTLFRMANAAYIGKENAKPDAKVDPVGAIEWEMGQERQAIVDAGRTKANKPFRDLANLRFNQLAEQRVAAQRRVEKREADRLKKAEQEVEDERKKYQGYIDELVADGKLDEERAQQIRYAYNEQNKYATRKKREKVTTPVLQKAMRSFPLPEPPFEREAKLKLTKKGRFKRPKTNETWEQIVARRKADLEAASALTQRRLSDDPKLDPKYSVPRPFTGQKAFGGKPGAKLKGSIPGATTANFFNDLKKWGEKLVDHATAELKKAGETLPSSADRNDNTPEENVFVFLRGRLGKLETREAQARDDNLQRGQTLVDAWGVMKSLQEHVGYKIVNGKRVRMSEAERYLQWLDDVDALYSQMFNAESKAGAADIAVASLADKTTQTEAENVAVEPEIYTTIEELESDTDLAAAFKRALKNKASGLDAPLIDKLKQHFDGPTRSTTGAKLLDQVSRHWRGADTKLGKALLASLKTLVGDVPVHFITGDMMQALRGQQSPGAYSRSEHAIFLHNQLEGHGGQQSLASVAVHELIHAASAYAIDNNIRGTGDIMNRLLGMVRRRSGTIMPGGALSNAHEFLTQALENGDFQNHLKSMPLDVSERAAIRALSRGRTTANMWDYTIAALENALGTFSPFGQRSFLDPILSRYPDMLMSSAEQQATNPVADAIDANRFLNAPFDMASYAPAVSQALDASLWRGRAADWRIRGRKAFHRIMAPTEHIRRDATERYFGGNFDNPLSRMVDAYQTHARRVEDEMKTGDVLGNDIMRWVSEGDHTTRWAALGDGLRTLLESSLDRLDARLDANNQPNLRDDAKHPTARPRKTPTLKHQLDAGRRALAERYHADWMKLDPELRDLLSKRADHMTAQFATYKKRVIGSLLKLLQRKANSPVVLPKGMSQEEAINQIYTDQISPELEEALGKNADTLTGEIAWFSENQLYMPTHRDGEYFISGRKDIPIPEGATFDKEAFDKRGSFQIRFDSLEDATRYIEAQGRDPEGERIINRQRRWVNPVTGERVRAGDHGVIKRQLWEAKPVYVLTLQDRYMKMGDSPADLEAERQELIKDGYDVSTPISMQDNRWPEKAMMPAQLSSLLHSIDSMSGIEEHEKAMARGLVTNAFVRQQQGSRIGKKMLRRQAVKGYSEGTTELMQALSTNNEMMSRSIVSVDRMDELNAALKEGQAYVDAARGDRRRIGELSPAMQTQVTRDYGSDPFKATMLANDVDEIAHRIKQSMSPSGRRWFGEHLQNALQSLTVLSYLGKPIYFALQTLGLPMQTWPAMAAEMSRGRSFMGGGFTANRYLNKAFAEVAGWKNYSKGLTEAMAETGQFAKGFLPRQGSFKHGRFLREQHNYIDDLVARIEAGDGSYKAEKVAMLKLARERNHIGQAGLEQANLRLDIMGEGPMNKFYRGVEQSMRVFRGIQEGIETNNRAVPMLAYLEYYLDSGMDVKTATEKAIGNMAREQVGYAKSNWPAWMSHPVAQPFMMFKKFGIQQAINYYGALRKSITGDEAGGRRQAIIHLMAMTGVLAAIGGLSGNPLWEPIRFLMYLLGLSDNWEVTKTKGEQWMQEFMGPEVAETAMYGLPRLVGIDLSSRVAMDSLLFYQQPKEMTQESWWSVIGQMAGGAPVATAMSTITGLYAMGGDQSYPKWLSTLPFPGMVKDIFKSYDSMVNGPSTATGVKTDKPPSAIEGIVQALGVRTRSQSRPFEQGSAAEQRLKESTSRGKSALVQRVLNQGMASNAERIKDWNRSQTDPKMRITVKDIAKARKRRGKMERDMRKSNAAAV